jgi:putative two-component system response regulator
LAVSASLTRLESLLSEGFRGGEPEVRLALSSLVSELDSGDIALEDGEHSRSYFLSLYNALNRLRGLSHAKLRLDAYFKCFLFFHLRGDSAKAFEAGERQRALAAQSGNPRQLSRAHLTLGIVHADEHRISDAVAHYAAAIDLARETDDVFRQTAGWVNLGTALNYGSLYRDAIPCFQLAWQMAEVSSETKVRELMPSAMCNLAQSHLYLGEFERAYDCIQKGLSISMPDATPHAYLNRTVREFTVLRISLELQLRDEARAHLDRCIQAANKSGSVRAAFLSSLGKGLFEVRFGDVHHGLQLLEDARNSGVTDIGVLRADALQALVRAYDEAGRPEKALACLQELIQDIKTTRTQGLTALRTLGKSSIDDALYDLRSIHLLEAKLRADVAEHEVECLKLEMLERLAVAADLKEDISGQHGFRVGALAAAIADVLHWEKTATKELELAARLHDIGKAAVPDRILLSPRALEQAERQFVIAHTLVGAELLGSNPSSVVRIAAQVAKCHHEWWNGEGYPSKLSGNRIPIHARIVALADVFDALTHGRPFSPAWPVDRALAEIRSRRGTQFDPDLTDIFLALMERLISEHEDLDAYLGRASRHSPFLQARNKIRRMLEDEREKERIAAVEATETRH